jgi:hypothetical protein
MDHTLQYRTGDTVQLFMLEVLYTLNQTKTSFAYSQVVWVYFYMR